MKIPLILPIITGNKIIANLRISLKLVNRLMSGKCLLTQIEQDKHRNYFLAESKKTDHPAVYFNDAPVTHTNCQNHLGIYLDKNLNFLIGVLE